MTTIRNVRKQLITKQDLALGKGKVIQRRGDENKELDKLDLVIGVSAVADLVVGDYDGQQVSVSGKLYLWNASSEAVANGTSVVAIPDVAIGRWLLLDDSVQGLDSIADLSGLVGDYDGQKVIVKGYHAGSDVGGGIFYWDSSRTSENDGGTVFDGWVRILEGYVTPEMFGARGDGLYDNTPALRRVVAYVNTSGGTTMTTVVFEKGTYMLDAPTGYGNVHNSLLVFTAPVNIIGNGARLSVSDSFLQAIADNTLTQYVAIILVIKKSVISGLNMDGGAASKIVPFELTGSLIVQGYEARDTIIENCTLTNAIASSIYLACAAKVTGCTMDVFGDHAIYMRSDNPDYSRHRGTIISGNTMLFGNDPTLTYDSVRGRDAIKFADYISGVVVTGNFVQSPMCVNMEVGARDVVIQGNTFICSYAGVAFASTVPSILNNGDNISIVGNNIASYEHYYGVPSAFPTSPNAGLMLSTATMDMAHVTFRGNTLNHAHVLDGWSDGAATSLTLDSNTFNDSNVSLTDADSSDNVIINNTFISSECFLRNGNNSVRHNTFKSCSVGVKVFNNNATKWFIIQGNQFIGCENCILYFQNANNLAVMDNVAHGESVNYFINVNGLISSNRTNPIFARNYVNGLTFSTNATLNDATTQAYPSWVAGAAPTKGEVDAIVQFLREKAFNDATWPFSF